MFFTTVEDVQIGFVIFDPLGVAAPVKGFFPADGNRELVPHGIDCLVSTSQNNQVQCFVDTIGPINYEVLYTIGQTEKAEGFITNGVLVDKAAFFSPRGFERIKTVQGYEMTGVLYKNNQVEPITSKVTLNTPRMLLSRQLQSGTTSVYTCKHLLEVYKKPHAYSYISYTCADFKIANTDTTTVPRFSLFGD